MFFAGDDYNATDITQSLIFLPGSTKECFIVRIINDTINEPAEMFTISARPEGSSDPHATTTVHIVDDDGETFFAYRQ